ADARLQHVETVDHAAHRLDQRCFAERHFVGQLVNRAFGYCDTLGESASGGYADRVPALAKVAIAALTEITLTAIERRIDPDSIADFDAGHLFADCDDRPAKLVARND